MSFFFLLPRETNQVPFHSGRFCVCPPQWIQVDRKTWQPTSFSLLCVSLILVPHVYLFYFAIFFCYVRFGHGRLLFRFRSLYSYFFKYGYITAWRYAGITVYSFCDDVRLWQESDSILGWCKLKKIYMFFFRYYYCGRTVAEYQIYRRRKSRNRQPWRIHITG
jgi:hypothetical protein